MVVGIVVEIGNYVEFLVVYGINGGWEIGYEGKIELIVDKGFE